MDEEAQPPKADARLDVIAGGARDEHRPVRALDPICREARLTSPAVVQLLLGGLKDAARRGPCDETRGTAERRTHPTVKVSSRDATCARGRVARFPQSRPRVLAVLIMPHAC